MTRVKQAKMNIESILGEMLNNLYDGIVDSYTEEEVIDYVYSEMLNRCVFGNGWTRYGTGICKDLKFIGKTKIVELIKSSPDFVGVAHYCE